MDNSKTSEKPSGSGIIMLPAVVFYAGMVFWFLSSAGGNSSSDSDTARVVPMENTSTGSAQDAPPNDPDGGSDFVVDVGITVESDVGNTSAETQNINTTVATGTDNTNDRSVADSSSSAATSNPLPATDQQQASIPDSDGDGVADHADLCPDSLGVADNRGCPADTDSDGLPDAQDQCPDQAGNLNLGGCPLDSDADGLPDDSDQCPDTAGDAAVEGCPAEFSTLKTIAGQISFDSASSRLTDESKQLLTQAARILGRYPQINITVAGHTDDQGDQSINLKLSEQRARACLNYLVKQGIDAERMTAIGYGESRPLIPNSTAAARDKNRRVEFIPGPG